MAIPTSEAPESHPHTLGDEFRVPLGARLLSLFVMIFPLLGALGLGGVAGYSFAKHQTGLGFFILFCAAVCGALAVYALRDLRGKWGLRVVLNRDSMSLDLPAWRSFARRPPTQHLSVPYFDVAAIESRYESFTTLGMTTMQRAYALRRKSGALIFLFEERGLATRNATAYYGKIANDMGARAGAPLRELGTVQGNAGVLGLWGTRAPDWDAPAEPRVESVQLWKHAAKTGKITMAIVLIAFLLTQLARLLGK